MSRLFLVLLLGVLCAVSCGAQAGANPFPVPSFQFLGFNPTPCYVAGQPFVDYLDAGQIRVALHAAFRAEGLTVDTAHVWTAGEYQMRLSGYDTAAEVGFLVYEEGMKGHYDLYPPEFRVPSPEPVPFSSAWIDRELDRVKTEIEGRTGPVDVRRALVEALRTTPAALPPYLTLLDRMAAYQPYDQQLFEKLVILTRLLPRADTVVSNLLNAALVTDTGRRLDAVRALGDAGWATRDPDRQPLLYDIAVRIAREAPRDTLRWRALDELRRETSRPRGAPITAAQLRRYRDGDHSWWVERRAARVAALASLERAENEEKLTLAEHDYLRTAFPRPAVLILQRGSPHTQLLTPPRYTLKMATQHTQAELTKAVRRWIQYVRYQRTAK